MAFTWNIPTATDVAIGTNVADDWLAAINAKFVANSGGANASWEVVSYVSSSPRSVLLRRKDASAGRIIFFGQQGSTAHANAVRGTATASHLYIAYSATSAVNVVDGSWLTGAPLAASDYIPGVSAWPFTASLTFRHTYAEFADGFYFLVSQVSNGYACAGAGSLVHDTTGSPVSAIQGFGSNWGSGWSSIDSATAAFIAGSPALDSAYATSGSHMVARVGSTNYLIYRAFSFTSAAVSGKLSNTADTKAYFYPIALVYNTSFGALNVLGKCRQVAFGPESARETTLIDNASPTAVGAYGHNYTTPTLGQSLWFTNFDV